MTRSDLSPESRALIALTRDAYEPTASNRAQVRWRVERRLSGRAARSSSRAWRPLALVAASVLAAAGAAAGTAFLWPEAAAPPATPQVTAAQAKDVPRASPESPPRVTAQPAVSSRPVPLGRRAAPTARSSQQPPASGDLAAETLLIARAQAATNRGQARRALELLNEYDRKFASGSLSEERSAARVVALCAAGRRDASRAEAERFLSRWPRSPQTARIRGSSCAPGSRSPAPR